MLESSLAHDDVSYLYNASVEIPDGEGIFIWCAFTTEKGASI